MARGQQGERGMQGDIGHTGAEGKQGATGRTEPSRTFFGWKRTTWALLAFLYIVLVGAFGQLRVEQLARRNARVNCEEDNKAIERDRNLVLVATSSGGGVDYTKEPTFAPLPDSVKTFLLARQSTGSAALRERLLVGLNYRDCKKEFPTTLWRI